MEKWPVARGVTGLRHDNQQNTIAIVIPHLYRLARRLGPMASPQTASISTIMIPAPYGLRRAPKTGPEQFAPSRAPRNGTAQAAKP